MKHPSAIHHLEQATMVSSDGWEQFFALCMEYAEIARQRRAAKLNKTDNEPETPTLAEGSEA